jgi:phosphoribosylformylglycinamidine synthase
LYQGQQVADLEMKFLHDGRPPVVRQAQYQPATPLPFKPPAEENYTPTLLRILASPNVASKEWIIRQYDHEVQGGSVIKPLVGVCHDGPSDAAVLRPVLSSRRGIVIACGMNPRYGEFDTYDMAASAIDEALRNCVAVGADPARIAILDNFCWGDCERPETLGSLVRAALACHDVSIALGTPFISGKDSLNNEFSYVDARGERQTIAIPPSLLISAIGQIDDVARAVTMDLKSPGNALYLVGETKDELGGSHFGLVSGIDGGRAPTVDPSLARHTFAAIHRAIQAGCIRACHDLSEGGLAVAVAEMAFAGGLGAHVELDSIPGSNSDTAVRLFSESNTRFLCEVPVERSADFERTLSGLPVAKIGEVQSDERLVIVGNGRPIVDASLQDLKAAWQGAFAG